MLSGERPVAPVRAATSPGTPIVQRAAGEAPPQPAPPTVPPAAGEAASAAAGVDVDDLARRVYEILRRRLRVERERSYGRGS